MKCKNNNSRYYTGDEPSPRGKGYCASSEKMGKRMTGKDGNLWEVVKTRDGTKRWKKVMSRGKKRKTSPRMDFYDDDLEDDNDDLEDDDDNLDDI